jgi:hypothetical protein
MSLSTTIFERVIKRYFDDVAVKDAHDMQLTYRRLLDDLVSPLDDLNDARSFEVIRSVLLGMLAYRMGFELPDHFQHVKEWN